MQTRNVSCAKTSDFEMVSEDLCDPQLRPPTNRSCATDPCQAKYVVSRQDSSPIMNWWIDEFWILICRWFIGEWTKCSSSNCQAGVQFRVVYCEQVISGSLPSVVDDAVCSQAVGPTPSSLQECNQEAICPQYHVEEWGPVKKPTKQNKLFFIQRCISFEYWFLNFDECSAIVCAEKANATAKPLASGRWMALLKPWMTLSAAVLRQSALRAAPVDPAMVSTGSLPTGPA